MEFFRKLNVENRRTVLLLVIEGFFQFKGYDYLSQSIWITKFLYILFLNSLMSSKVMISSNFLLHNARIFLVKYKA